LSFPLSIQEEWRPTWVRQEGGTSWGGGNQGNAMIGAGSQGKSQFYGEKVTRPGRISGVLLIGYCLTETKTSGSLF